MNLIDAYKEYYIKHKEDWKNQHYQDVKRIINRIESLYEFRFKVIE